MPATRYTKHNYLCKPEQYLVLNIFIGLFFQGKNYLASAIIELLDIYKMVPPNLTQEYVTLNSSINMVNTCILKINFPYYHYSFASCNRKCLVICLSQLTLCNKNIKLVERRPWA